jgi:hypothetical protein
MTDTESGATQPSVRHFRQILLWPLSLTPLRASAQVQHHWQTFLTGPGADCAWEPREAEWNKEDGRFEERHYREFVTFLPHVQRFLYGQTRGKRVGHGYGEAPMRVFRRRDIAHVRIHLEDEVHTFQVQHVDLYFFHDVDVAMLALELHGSNLRLASVQDLLYRFGRIYPVMWDDAGRPLQCARNVEWLSHAGEVLSESDFHDRERFLDHACEHRNARVGAHWEFMLWPMVPEQSERPGSLRYRQLDYYRLPKLTYLALDDPFQLTREDFYRLGMASAPDDGLVWASRTRKQRSRRSSASVVTITSGCQRGAICARARASCARHDRWWWWAARCARRSPMRPRACSVSFVTSTFCWR